MFGRIISIMKRQLKFIGPMMKEEDLENYVTHSAKIWAEKDMHKLRSEHEQNKLQNKV